MIEVGTTIAGDLRIEQELDAARGEWLGSKGGTPVRVLTLTAAEAALWRNARSVDHAHLAKLIDLVLFEGEQVAVIEHVPGVTLATRLAEIGRKPEVDAVRSALRLADAVSSLHLAGAAHGAIGPELVYVEAEHHGAPMLTYGKGPGARSPERGDTGSEADDTWAVTSLLWLMLVGSPPPAAGLASTTEAAAAGVADPELAAALLHGLNQNAAERATDLRALKRELARWFVDHAADEPHPVSRSTAPPPLPPSSPPPVVTASVPVRPVSVQPAPPPRRAVLPFALGAIAIGLIGAWAWRETTSVKVKEVVAPKVAQSAPVPAAKAIDLAEGPAGGSASETAACAGAFLPQGALPAGADVTWLCQETDPRKSALKLGEALGAASDAGKLHQKSGWYRMTSVAVLRTACCVDAKALALPDPSAGCGDLDDALARVGKEAADAKPVAEQLDAYAKAATCESAAGKSAAFEQSGAPTADQRQAFESLVQIAKK